MPVVEAGMKDLGDGSAKDGKLSVRRACQRLGPVAGLGRTHKKQHVVHQEAPGRPPLRGRLQGGRQAERVHMVLQEMEIQNQGEQVEVSFVVKYKGGDVWHCALTGKRADDPISL